jgi:hypothetical protein
MSYPKKETPPSEWQTDENGRRFRWEGNIKSYEMMVSIGGTMVPESQVEEFNARNKAAIEARVKADQEAARRAPHRGRCPFSSGIVQTCTDKCALCTPDGCGLVHRKAPGATAGKSCPFSAYSCTTDCELYNNGCRLVVR